MSVRPTVVAQCLVAALAVVFLWFFRYEIVPVNSGNDHTGYAYKLDRWTGDVRLLIMEHDVPVKP